MIVYCTTNLINGKKYIGMDRRNCHSYFGSGVFLKKAIKKYGKQNFVKEILQYCDSLENLKKAEEYWINHYNAIKSNKFYNINLGVGEGIYLPSFKGKKQSESHIHNRRLAQIGKPHPLSKFKCIYCNKETTKTNIVQYHNENCINREFESDQLRQEVIKRRKVNHERSVEHTEKIISLHSKKVKQYDLNGNFIAEFKSLQDATKSLNKSNGHLSAILNGKYKTNIAYGYKWG